MATLISNSGSDERGKLNGGQAGDQTGREWRIINWYSRPWTCVLRHPDPKVRAKIAELAKAAAENDKIGYDQYQRDTYWNQLKANNYNPSKISTPCEADCSAGVIANVKATGYILGDAKLQNVNATYTGNMRSGFKAAGFTCLTDKKYLESGDYLVVGDILLNDSHHTATVISAGGTTTAAKTTTSKAVTAKEGAKSFDKALAGAYTVTAGSLNMRNGAGIDSTKNIMVALERGTTVTNYGYYTLVGNTKWLYVKVAVGEITYTGFCSGVYLKRK